MCLWLSKTPYLYNTCIDNYLGFKQISLGSKKKKRIYLNNKPYFMIRILDQGYWADDLYRSLTDDAYQYNIKQMK
ncbi:unnamed protein product, partial [Adineta steineri]